MIEYIQGFKSELANMNKLLISKESEMKKARDKKMSNEIIGPKIKEIIAIKNNILKMEKELPNPKIIYLSGENSKEHLKLCSVKNVPYVVFNQGAGVYEIGIKTGQII
jgi:hypothetical protein